MRPASLLLGLWMGACTSGPASEGSKKIAHPVVAAAVPETLRIPAPSTLRIVVGGDVIPHRPQLLEPESISAALAPLAPIFHAADAVVVNYETATGDIARTDAAPLSLAAKPAWMHAVASSSVTAVTLANNHACDLGARGLAASLDTANAEGLTALGVDARDPWAPRTIASRDGHRVCAVAWTTFVNDRRAGCGSNGHLAIAKANHEGRARVAKAIATAIHEGCDAVIAIVHGGEEYVPQTDAMMNVARGAAEAGADVIVMHHPHVVSPLVVHTTEDGRRVPIFASLGNLVSNQGESWTPAYPAAQKDRHIVYLNGWTRIGMLADLDVRFDAPNRQKIAAFGYHLVFVESDHVLDKSNPHPRIVARPLDPASDHAIVDKLSRDAAGPRAIFEDACWIERRSEGDTAGASCR